MACMCGVVEIEAESTHMCKVNERAEPRRPEGLIMGPCFGAAADRFRGRSATCSSTSGAGYGGVSVVCLLIISLGHIPMSRKAVPLCSLVEDLF